MFVYIMIAKPYMKIGISRDVERRLGEVQTGCPVRITRVLFYNAGTTGSAERIEKLLHDRYAACNTWGEWFTYSIPRVQAISSMFPEMVSIELPTIVKDNSTKVNEYSKLILGMYHRKAMHELKALENELNYISDKAGKRKLLRKLDKYITKLRIQRNLKCNTIHN